MDISKLDMNLVRVLDALLQTGSTVAAASHVGLSQPAVSAALGRLRHALGDELFVRRGQGLEPTDYAKSLTAPLRRNLTELELLLGGPQPFDPATATDIFRLGGSDFFAELLMPRLGRLVSKLAPGVRLQFLNLADADLEAMERLEIDLALMPVFPVRDHVALEIVMRSHMVVVARADHERIRAEGLSPGDVMPLDLYCELGHVVFSTEGKLQALGDAALAETGRRRNVAMTLPFFSALGHVLTATDLIAMLPGQTAQSAARLLDLAVYRLPFAIDPIALAMIWYKRADATPAHQWLRASVRQIAVQLEAGYPLAGEPAPDTLAPEV